MLTRIVIMNFEEENIQSFLKIFEQAENKIRTLPGCIHLELKRNVHNHSQLATISKWNSEKELNNYRDSEFFKDTWQKTKALFSTDAEAFSFVDVDLK
ncbi:MAG TPA: antibiotic biosynthesis monooxygenase [Cyclobacteriaceae bacterium]